MTVTLYSTGCPKCKVLKKKLKESGVEFTEVNDIDEMLKLGFSKVPVLSINGNNFDFNQAMKWLADM